MSTGRPAISVITVFYNREEFVDDSIRSLLNQTFYDFELIIVDDGSTDGTRERLVAFDDPRIRLLFKANSGFTDSIIHAVNGALGEFIAIHGSGDISLPTRLDKQHALLAGTPDIGVVGCWVENVQADGSARRRDLVDDTRPFPDLLQEVCVFTHGEVMYRKRAYEEAGGYRRFFQFSQDYDLWFRMSEHYEFAVVPEVLYRRLSPPDTIRTDPKKMLVQLQLSELARQSAVRRRTGGRDIVDEFGPLAFTQMEQSRALGNQLVGIGANMVIRRNNPEGNLLIRAGMLHAPTWLNQLRKMVADHRGGPAFAMINPLLKMREAARERRKERKQRRRSRST
jgi:glycosyltransferase involved in cell wall biosynthesis